MRTILAIDTSATPVSCALLRDQRVLATYYTHTGQTHSQTLMPMVDSVLAIAGLSVKDLDAVAVSAGPGSFTGVRIGVSAAKGLAFTDDIPCIGVSTLEAMAESFQGLPFDGVICSVMDARCQQVYTASFCSTADGCLERMTQDEAISIEELKNQLKKYQKSVILVGDGAQLCYNMLKDELPFIYLAPVSVRYQSAVGVAQAAQRRLETGQALDAETLQPVYLRLPQAERELKARKNLNSI